MRLQAATIHHAALLMDLFMSRTSDLFPLSQVMLAFLACLMISCKFLELKYPSAANLAIMVQDRYTEA